MKKVIHRVSQQNQLQILIVTMTIVSESHPGFHEKGHSQSEPVEQVTDCPWPVSVSATQGWAYRGHSLSVKNKPIHKAVRV